MNFVSVEEKLKEGNNVDKVYQLILNPKFSASLRSQLMDLPVFVLAVVGMTRMGKSLLLSMIAYAMNKFFHRTVDDIDERLFTSRHTADGSRVTSGGDFRLIRLRNPDGVLLLFDFEGLGNDDNDSLSILLAVATQLTNNLMFVTQPDPIDTPRNQLERLVASTMVQAESGEVEWPQLTICLNKCSGPVNTQLYRERLDEREAIRVQLNRKDVVALRFFDMPTAQDNPSYDDDDDDEDEPNSQRIDEASMEEVFNTPFGRRLKPLLEQLDKNLFAHAFQRNGQQFTLQAYAEYVTQFLNQTNAQLKEGRGTAHVPNATDMIRGILLQHVEKAKADYIANPAKPIVANFTGREVQASIVQQHATCVNKAMEVFTASTKGLRSWPVYGQTVEQLNTHFQAIQTALVQGLTQAIERLMQRRTNYVNDFQRQLGLLRNHLTTMLGNEFPADAQRFQQVLNTATITAGNFRQDCTAVIQFYRPNAFQVIKNIPAVTVNDEVPVYDEREVREFVRNEEIRRDVKRCMGCGGESVDRFLHSDANNDRNSKIDELEALKREGVISDFHVRGFHTGGLLENYRFMYSYHHVDDCARCHNSKTVNVLVGHNPIFNVRKERFIREIRREVRVIQAAQRVTRNVQPLCQLLEELMTLQQQHQQTF